MLRRPGTESLPLNPTEGYTLYPPSVTLLRHVAETIRKNRKKQPIFGNSVPRCFPVSPTSSATLPHSTPWHVPSRAPLIPLSSTPSPRHTQCRCLQNLRSGSVEASSGSRCGAGAKGRGRWWWECAPDRGSIGKGGEECPRIKRRSWNSALIFALKRVCLMILKFW